jgi:hypothetical protein
MDRAETIAEILRLVPGTPEGQGRAGRLLDALPEQDLQRTLSELTALTQDGQAWIQRADPTGARRAAMAVIDRQGLQQLRRARASLDDIANRVEERRDKAAAEQRVAAAKADRTDRVVGDLEVLASSLDHWQPSNSAMAAEEIAAEVSKTAEALRNPSPRLMARGQAAAGRPLDAIRQKISNLLRHPVVWSDRNRLDKGQTIEALARMENFVADTTPDIIVAMNPDSRAISQLIMNDLGLHVPLVLVEGSAKEGLVWDLMTPAFPRGQSICLIGHVAWSGSTIDRVLHQARQRFRSHHISVVVLASSTEAAERISGQARFAFHHITAARQVELTIQLSGMAIEDQQYRFPTSYEPARNVLVSSAALADARRRIKQVFGDGLVWDVHAPRGAV